MKKNIILKFNAIIFIILVISCSNQSKNEEITNSNIGKKVNQYLSDTSNKKLLKECDSILLNNYSVDSNNYKTLFNLKIIRAHLNDFNFLLNRIYPKLYKNNIKQLHYENFKVYDYLKDTIKYCVELNNAYDLYKDINYNDISNFSDLVNYIEILNRIYGRNHVDKFIQNEITNPELIDVPYSIDKQYDKITERPIYCSCSKN